jgi:hypothetical protein
MPRVDQLTRFRRRMTLNRSKSFSALRLAIISRDLAKELSFHCFSTSASSHFDFKAPCPMARGSLGMTMCVRAMFERGAECRGTSWPFVFEGPSTSTFALLAHHGLHQVSGWSVSSRTCRATYAFVVDDFDNHRDPRIGKTLSLHQSSVARYRFS